MDNSRPSIKRAFAVINPLALYPVKPEAARAAVKDERQRERERNADDRARKKAARKERRIDNIFEATTTGYVWDARKKAKKLIYDMGGDLMYQALEDPLFDTLYHHLRGSYDRPNQHSIMEIAYIVLMMHSLYDHAKKNASHFFTSTAPGLKTFNSGEFQDELNTRLRMLKPALMEQSDTQIYINPIVQSFLAATRERGLVNDMQPKLNRNMGKLGFFMGLYELPSVKIFLHTKNAVQNNGWINLKIIMFALLPALVTYYMTFYY